MRYMFLVYLDEHALEALSTEERNRTIARAWAVRDEATKLGIFRGSDRLQPADDATTVRLQDGKPLVTDGPFAETKEQLAGYFILDCEDLDGALEWATKLGNCGAIEVRPMMEVPRPE